jgi:hypothetical protein
MFGGFFGTLFILWMLYMLPSVIASWLEQREAKQQAEAQEKFKRENPELWREQEMLKLEKERLETQKKLAYEQARSENTRRNVGMGVAIGRAMGWW